jgi:hypothetical protein
MFDSSLIYFATFIVMAIVVVIAGTALTCYRLSGRGTPTFG